VNTDLSRWSSRAVPARRALQGRWCRLEPLGAEHADDLFAASTAPGADERFRYLFESAPDRPEFDAWLARVSNGDDPLFFAVVDARTGQCHGRQALMRTVPEHGVTEIGSILWGPAITRTRVATEALYLAARYVFDELGYRRLEWKCHSENAPSRRAAVRFGFTFEGVFRQHMVFKGGNRDTAWFAMLDVEWPVMRQAYDGWLDPANFDPDGVQRAPLAARVRPIVASDDQPEDRHHHEQDRHDDGHARGGHESLPT
jgi:RimJ/RimL family protein N-acetyltransferase